MEKAAAFKNDRRLIGRDKLALWRAFAQCPRAARDYSTVTFTGCSINF